MLAFNADVYNGLKFIHVLAAICWVGSGLFVQSGIAPAQRTTPGPPELGRDAESTGQRGSWASSSCSSRGSLVRYGPCSFNLWILLGLVGFAAHSLTGLSSSAHGEKFAAAPERGADHPDLPGARARIILISRIDHAVLVLMILDMVFKPGCVRRVLHGLDPPIRRGRTPGRDRSEDH